MPAPPLANTFETGLADTTVITTANSDDGSAGNAFGSITGSPTFSTAQAKSGTLSGRIDTTATYAETHMDFTGFGAITTAVWFRLYLYATANPAATLRLMGIRTPSANSAFLFLGTGGLIQGGNAAQSGVGSAATVPIALNQWVRIELRVVSSTTVGELEWWLYNTPEAPVGSFDDHNAATGLVLGASTDISRFGGATAVGPNSYIFWLDDLAVSSTGQIGPSLVTDTGLAWITA